MTSAIEASLFLLADTSGAISIMRDYVTPTIKTLSVLATLVCTLFIIQAGYLYMSSAGRPDRIEQAKHIFRNTLIGLVLVLAAGLLVLILSGAYGSPAGGQPANLPSLESIEPNDPGNGLVDVLIKATTGFLNNIIQTIATPFLSALEYFTKATPLMADNSSVFGLWLAIVGITNVLMVLILALVGLHVMSASSLGFDEIEFKHLLPRIGLVFLFVNTSIFAIDAVIELSNVLIRAIGSVSGSSSVWETLTKVVQEASGQSLAALLLMLAFLILTVILLVYYVGRLVTLFIGAVLSPLVILIWLLPGFRDFSESAMKTYLTTIFVLFVHVVILQLAASLFVGMSGVDAGALPNALMSMVVGLATVVVLLRTQGVMMQFAYVSVGARNARKLGGQFLNGVSYMTSKNKSAAEVAAKSISPLRSNVTQVQMSPVRKRSSGPGQVSSIKSVLAQSPASKASVSRPKVMPETTGLKPRKISKQDSKENEA